MVKSIIDNVFKSVKDYDEADMALNGNILDSPTKKIYFDKRGNEYGHFEVVRISGGYKITYFSLDSYRLFDIDDDTPTRLYTVLVSAEDFAEFDTEVMGQLK